MMMMAVAEFPHPRGQIERRDIRFTAHADSYALRRCETAGRRQAKLPSKQGIVPKGGMQVEWQMRAVDRDPFVEQNRHTVVARPGYRLRSRPEHPMMKYE